MAFRARGFAKANLTRIAEDRALVFDEKGVLALAAPSPDGMEILAKAKVLEETCWSGPTVVGTRVYLRNRTEMVALELGGNLMQRALTFLSILTLGALPTAPASEIPERSASGLTLEVHDEQLDAGQAYYVVAGDTQLTIRSRADLQSVTASSARAVGYLIGPFVDDVVEDGLEQPILAGALRIPTQSLRCGHAGTDGRLHGKPLLDVSGHPEITVRFESLSGVEALSVPEEQQSELVRARGTAAVAVTFKGEERPLEVPVELSFRLSSGPAMSRMVGDLATVSSTFELNAADWGVEIPPPLAALVAPKLQVELFLLLSTVNPDAVVILIPREQYLTERRIRVLLRDERRTRDGYTLAREHLQAHWDDPVVLNRVALELATLDDVERRDFPLIIEAAQRADELTEGGDADVLATLARIQFEMGHVDRAVELQERAIAQIGNPEGRPGKAASAQLEEYEAALPKP